MRVPIIGRMTRAAWGRLDVQLTKITYFDLTVALCLTICLRVLFLVTRGLGNDTAFFSDDALITLRYAQNLSHGYGFVYNVGEKVLGTTTPLYTLLMAIPAAFNLNLLWTAALFNLVVDCASVVLLRHILIDRVRSSLGRILLLSLFAANPVIVFWSSYGMEVSLLVFLTFLGAWWFWNDKYWCAGGIAGLVVLTRIDGVLFVGALGLVWLVVTPLNRRLILPWKSVVGFVTVIVPWLVFSMSYFGSMIPNSVLAKRVVYQFVDMPIIDILNLGAGWGVLPLAVAGGYSLAQGRSLRSNDRHPFENFALTLLVWAVVLLLFFTVTRAPAHIYEWYRVPVFASVAVLGMIGCMALFRDIFAESMDSYRISSRVTVAIACILPILFFYGRPVAGQLLKPKTEIGTTMHLAVGRWLKQHAEAGSTVIVDPVF